MVLQKKIAVLITCYNRKDKTISCLRSFLSCKKPNDYLWQIFLVDDSSQDETSYAVLKEFPETQVFQGNGHLFWAGGMRLAFEEANKYKQYDGFLLLNDDVVLNSDVLLGLLRADEYALEKFGKRGIYAASTAEPSTGLISYGASRITQGFFRYKSEVIKPQDVPVLCSLANANILLIMREVIDETGFFDPVFTHGIADYDFTLSATRAGYPLLLIPGIGGYCVNDHGNNWMTSAKPLKERIRYLYSVKGLAYKENLYYLKKHFPRQRPYYIMMYWLKTFFPSLWDKFKK